MQGLVNSMSLLNRNFSCDQKIIGRVLKTRSQNRRKKTGFSIQSMLS